MPSRIIREGILTSDRINKLSPGAELFYRRLMSVVDDYGRFDGRLVMLKVACFPLRVDLVKEEEVAAWAEECIRQGLVQMYLVEGKPFVEMMDFRQQRRMTKSKCPDPLPDGVCVADAKQMLSIRVQPYTCFVVEVVVGCGGAATTTSTPTATPPARKRASARKTPLPENFAVSPRVEEWAEKNGHHYLPERLEDFVDKARARGYQYADWDAAFMCAVRNNWAEFVPDQPKRVAL